MMKKDIHSFRRIVLAVFMVIVFLAMPVTTVSAAAQTDTPLYFEESTVIIRVGQQMSLPLKTNGSVGKIYYRTNHPEIVSVDGSGVMTANSKGYATITAKLKDGTYAKCVVRSVVPVSKVVMSAEVIKISVGEKKRLSASVSPDDAYCKTIEWSSGSPKVASVSNGLVTGLSGGMSLVTAASPEGKKGYCVVMVEVPPEQVTVSDTKLFLTKGDELPLNAKVLPENAANKSLTYKSSDPSVVTVDGNGTLRATGRGVAYVKAVTFNKKTVNVRVKVYDPVRSVTMQDSVTLGERERFTLEPVISPSVVLDRTLVWNSTAPEVATVENGVITAVSPGAATITATAYNGVAAECAVTVKKEPYMFRLEPSSVNVGVGESFRLNTVFTGYSASNEKKFTSGTPEICTVTQDGTVTALKEGTAVITCRLYNGLKASARVTVKSPPAGISLDRSDITLTVGGTDRLSVLFREGQASLNNSFVSDNKKTVSVDGQGNITALSSGSACITVTAYNGASASCRVTVLKKPAWISFDKSSLEMLTGDSAVLSASIPDGSMAEYTFSSANPKICTIDAKGRVNALSEGETVLTVTADNGVKDTCRVTVKQSVTWIGLYAHRKVMIPGQTYTLKYYLPAYEYTHGITYTSTDESVCTVTQSGLIRAVGTGTATVRIRSHNGKTDECSVTVTYDGKLLSEDPSTKPALYKRFKAICQYPELPTGCEITALTMTLNFYGYNVTKEDMADNYLEKGLPWTTDFREAFAGDPRSVNAYGCYAPVIVDSANKYLTEHKSSLRARELIGLELEDLLNFTENGTPVLVWTTMDLVQGYYTASWEADNGETVTWYCNEHCMVLLGQNKKNNTVYAADPDKGAVVEYDMELFRTRYKELFTQAVVLL